MSRKRGRKYKDIIGTLVTPEQRIKIDEFVDKYNVSLSKIMRIAIVEYMDKYEEELKNKILRDIKDD